MKQETYLDLLEQASRNLNLFKSGNEPYDQLIEQKITIAKFKECFEKNKINPNAADRGLPLFSNVCLYSNVDTKEKIDYLLSKGANPNATSTGLHGSTAVHYMIANEAYDLAFYIINKGLQIQHINQKLNLNTQDNNGKTLLLMATQMRHSGLARHLIDLGAKISTPDNDGRSPLHMAAITGNTEIFQLLIEKGADIDYKDKNGLSPLDYLAMSKKERLEYLHAVLEDVQIDPKRDEKAIQNQIIDTCFDKVEVSPDRRIRGRRFFSTKEDGEFLLQNTENLTTKNLEEGLKLHFNPGDEQFIINQINAFTGKTLEEVCLKGQAELFYKHSDKKIEPSMTINLLNNRLRSKNILDHSFIAQEKLYINDGKIVDAVIEMPQDKKERETLENTIKSLLPKEIMTHLYEVKGEKKIYLMISDINNPEKAKAIWNNKEIFQGLDLHSN